MPEPTYDELSAESGRLLDEREEWRRNIREQGAQITKLTAERNAALDRTDDDAWTRKEAELAEARADPEGVSVGHACKPDPVMAQLIVNALNAAQPTTSEE